MFHDLRYAIRILLKSPGFTFTTVLTLAIAIGATTAIFSAVQTTILWPLPVKDPDRLFTIEEFNAKEAISHRASISPATIAGLRKHPEMFERLALHDVENMKYRGGEFVETLRGSSVSSNYFALLGVPPALGRSFSPDETPASNVVILSHAFWRSRLGGDASIVGKTVEFCKWGESTDERFTVIGVMPASFVFPDDRIDYWVPLGDFDLKRLGGNYDAYFRLPNGASGTQAQAIFDLLSAREAAENAKFYSDWRMRLRPVRTLFADDSTLQKLWTLFAVIGLVWVIACANVANLLLARAASRQHEMATRAALGAGRSRLIRQLLTESLLLALAGGLCGLVLTQWGISALGAFLGGIRLRPLALSGQVFLSALGISILTGVVFGLAPAWCASRPGLFETLKQSGAASTLARRGRWLLRGLIVAELAFAVMILAAAGLMIRSAVNVLRADLGFGADNLLMAVAVPGSTARSSEETYIAFIDRLGDNYAQIPGVLSVGVRTIFTRRYYTADSDQRSIEVVHEGCGLEERNLFAALRVPLIEGRFLDRSDIKRDTVVVNHTLARTFWPGQSAIGKLLHAAPGQDTRERTLEVVGVVGDVRLDKYEADLQPVAYRPCQEHYRRLHYDRFYLRTTVDPASITRAVHAAMNQADPDVIERIVQQVSQELYRSTQGRRFFTFYVALFAGIGLALATIGLYGLMAYSVQRRTREFGIRMALGSTARGLLMLVMREGIRLVALGLALGLAGALLGGRLLQSQVYGVSPRDPATLAALGAVLFLAAAIACFIPARRAARVDPMVALRSE